MIIVKRGSHMMAVNFETKQARQSYDGSEFRQN